MLSETKEKALLTEKGGVVNLISRENGQGGTRESGARACAWEIKEGKTLKKNLHCRKRDEHEKLQWEGETVRAALVSEIWPAGGKEEGAQTRGKGGH